MTAPGGQRNWSSSGPASGRKNKERGGGRAKGTRVASWSNSDKREEYKGRRGNAGSTRRSSERVPRVAVKKSASGFDRRKRKIDDDSWDDVGGGKNASSSKSKFTRKTASTISRRKVAPGKVDRLKSQSFSEDSSRSGRSTSKVPDISRGITGRSALSKNSGASLGKKFDASTEFKRTKKGAVKDVALDEEVTDSKKSDDSDHITEEEKPRPRLARVLDRSGKKIKPAKKDVVPDAEEPTPPKKRKRMKLDPYDTSNKRIEDSPPIQAASSAEKVLVKCAPEETEMSINAKFRAIQPTPSMLSYVEDNLLGRRRLNEIKNAGYNVKISAPLDNVPFSTSTERERIEESVFRNKLEFFAAAKISSSFPPPTLPEIAFAGVSNVGKSSLLNALTRQWGIVRTSDKPGLTQSINFFRLASKLCLVDLPGYGFAYAKEEVKESWQELKKCLLVHTKRGMKPLDYELVDLMERHKTPYQIVLTKTDLVFPIDVARRAMEIQESLKKNKSVVNPVMMVSSKTGAGIRNLRDDKAETDHLLALAAGAGEGRLRIFRCDLLDGAVLLDAARVCSGVFHLASPCIIDPVSDPRYNCPKQLIVPAAEGTLNVLRAAKEAGGVRRVVVTSSNAAIMPSPGWPAGEVPDERCWTDIDYCEKNGLWYSASKTLAEKAAWKFAEENGLGVVVVNPSCVMGPIIPPTINSSMPILLRLLQVAELYPNYKVPKFPKDTQPGLVRAEVGSKKLIALGLQISPLEKIIRDAVESLKSRGYIS
ncbi:uncharacterized protein C2845_PM01G22170 [Panicum miliaceum]|uniref:EngB-type G domain-containing protein n=1 Tax=Panicum miliaceum TaxID=4540 RepID=A0A3L6TPR3_PANMI|nr:uncharacterized protein C2845_PM01G22170 [Panicum miliaceum]